MRNTFFALLAFAQTCCFGQAGYTKLFDFDHPGATFNNMSVHGDTISLYGFVIGTSAPYLQGMMLSQLDTDGVVLNYKTYFDSIGDDYGFYFPSGFIKLSKDGGYAMLGTLFSRRNGFLMKTDKEANQVYFKEYPDATSATDYYRKIIELQDGFLIGGDKQLAANLNDHQVFVMRTDKQGNKIWEKWFGSANRLDVLSSMVKVNDNEFVISCSAVNFYDPMSQWAPATKMIALDTLGNVKWEKPFFYNEDGGVALQKCSNGDWIYSTVEIVFDLDVSLDWFTQAKLVRRDSNFNFIWEKKVGSPTSMYNNFIDLKPAPEGGYISAGSYQESYFIYPDAYPTGWICRWSEEGDSLWSRKDKGLDWPGVSTESYLAAVEPLPSGSFIACGYSREPSKTWSWLVKINRDGCIDTLLCTTSSVQPEAIINHWRQVKVYPNPVFDFLTFDWAEATTSAKRLLLRNALGQPLKDIALSGGGGEAHTLSVRDMPPGIYFWALLTADGRQVGAGKIIKE